MSEAPPPLPGSDPAREPWEQDLLALALELSRSRGDVVPFAMDGGRICFLNSAAAVQHVLVEQRHRYVSVPFPLSRISSAFTEPGAALLRQKLREAPRVPSPPLGELVTTALDVLLDRLAAASRAGAPVDLLPHFKTAMLGLMTRTLFGVTLPMADIEAAAEAKRLMERYRAYPLPPGAVPRGTALWQRLQTAHETDCAYSSRILAAVGLYDLLPPAGESAPRFDDEQLGASGAQPVALVSRLLMNSYNGPAIALAWIAWALGQPSAVQATLAAEAARVFGSGSHAFDDGLALPYARQVVQETLRLYPPAWLIARQPTEDDVIGSFHVGKNDSLVLSPYTLHRDRRYWMEPESFRPERFEARAAKPSPAGAYLPFGLGPGMCPAGAFALKELTYATARLAHRFHLNVAPGTVVRPWGLISLHPEPGAVLTLREHASRG